MLPCIIWQSSCWSEYLMLVWHAYSLHGPLSNSLHASSHATSRTSTEPPSQWQQNAVNFQTLALGKSSHFQTMLFHKWLHLFCKWKSTSKVPWLIPWKGCYRSLWLCCTSYSMHIQWWIPIRWLGLYTTVRIALYCSTTRYLHISITTNVTLATWWHACSLVQTKHPSHHHSNNGNHTEIMEKEEVWFVIWLSLYKKHPAHGNPLTCKSLWSIRIRNVTIPHEKIQDINTGKGEWNSLFWNIQGHFGGFHS